MANEATLKTNITADNTQFIKAAIDSKNKIKQLADSISNEYGQSLKEAQAIARSTFANTQRQLQMTQREVSKTSSAFKELGRGLGVLLAGVLSVDTFMRVADSIDRIGYTAAKLNLPIEQFQEFQYVAGKADTDIGTFEAGLKRLRTTLGEAVGGNKEALKSFSDLGLSAKELNKLGIGDVYKQVADAINGKTNSNDQASAAGRVFGAKSGQDQLNIIRSLKDASKEYRELDVGLTKEQMAVYDQLDKRLDWTRARIDDGLKKSVIALIPVVTALGDAFAYALQKGFGLTELSRGLGEGATAARNLIKGEYQSQAITKTSVQQNMVADAATGNPNRRENLILDKISGGSGGDSSSIRSGTMVDVKTAANQIAQSFQELSISSSSAAEALKTLADGTLKNLLGIKATSGKEYLSSILTPIKQTKDPLFTRLANELRDNVASGTQGFGSSNESKVAQLEAIARQSGGKDGESNSGMLAAVKELKEAMKAIKKGNQVTVIVKVKDNEFISAVVESDTFFKSVTDFAVKAADDSARQAVR